MCLCRKIHTEFLTSASSTFPAMFMTSPPAVALWQEENKTASQQSELFRLNKCIGNSSSGGRLLFFHGGSTGHVFLAAVFPGVGPVRTGDAAGRAHEAAGYGFCRLPEDFP
ncbi:hypothetical protein CRENBAI_010038 [Crenichthys baileyi]|uniref:Uncharacterized protein n=1 Tax=Crenichthys baileyi TaxID=28760 RepID=A0AAV9S585_9TELE